MDGQLRLEGFEEPAAEPQAKAPSEEELEQRLREARKLKVQSFKLAGDEEEDNDPSEEPEEYDDSELEDFTSYDDAETVQNELTYRRRIGWIQVLLTGSYGADPAGGGDSDASVSSTCLLRATCM